MPFIHVFDLDRGRVDVDKVTKVQGIEPRSASNETGFLEGFSWCEGSDTTPTSVLGASRMSRFCFPDGWRA